MMKFTQVSAEIEAVADKVREEFGRPDVLLVTQRVLTNHPDINGVDADFYVCCTYRAVRHEARQRINSELADTPDSQMTLEGFEHLQKHYQVTRDSKVETVPVQEMTDAEIEEKANQYDAMGRACMAHADELRRYKDLRQADRPGYQFPLSAHEDRPSI